MVASLHKYLGSGLYTVAEAALYARVPAQLLQRWIFGSKKGQPVIDAEFGHQERVVSFLDFIQALAIREIRLQHRVPLLKFRQAVKVAKDYYKLDCPFARKHFTYYDGEELIIRPTDKEFVEASGKHRGQRLFPFVELYIKSLSIDPKGLASLYRIYKSQDDVPIDMNPTVRFGEPMLPSGYSAMAIWDSIRAEGSIERAAKVYGISKEEAEAADRFFVDYLGRTSL